MKRSVREMRTSDINLVIDYFLGSDAQFLKALGVDANKLPGSEQWRKIISDELQQPVETKKLYYVIWEINELPVGHSHISDIVFGKEAYMHLHLWHPEDRNIGNGSYFVKESLSYYFQRFKLKKLYCQPYALNPAPNKTLANAGFEFIRDMKAYLAG